MRAKGIRSVAVIGGGPAGAALATHLTEKGIAVGVFSAGQRPPLVVGESLVPAVVPHLQKLGIEEEIASISTYKPGATFSIHSGHEVSFVFSRAGRNVPSYAYNVSRSDLDSIIAENARRNGAIFIDARAELVKIQKEQETPSTKKNTAIGTLDSEVALAESSLALWRKALQIDAPDLIVDASGRNRVIARFLDLPGWEGTRKDVALFAHHSEATTPHEGHIHINRIKQGWTWRIPLPGRVSVGVVLPKEAARQHGATAEEQYDTLCLEEPTLSTYFPAHRNGDISKSSEHPETVTGTRLTPVMKYSNYQLASEVWASESYALVGDAGGFVDPIFSSGLLLSLEGAELLAHSICKGWSKRSIQSYERMMKGKMKAWQSLIESFYDGSMFSLFRLKTLYQHSRLLRFPIRLVDRQLALALSGVDPSSKHRLWLLRGLLHILQRQSAPHRFRIAA